MWIVCQVGAREHYAVARALQKIGQLKTLVTDVWCPPGSYLRKLPGIGRLRERYDPELETGHVLASNGLMLAFELQQRICNRTGWPLIRARNKFFQCRAIRSFSKSEVADSPHCLFSYSYAALDLFRYAKTRGWTTILGQIDPGPEEERIVLDEQRRYPHLTSSWQPAPPQYWRDWREEIALADLIVVNSIWSRNCLIKDDVPEEKIKIIPLVYENEPPARSAGLRKGTRASFDPLRVLFLGQINLRKGIGRLLDAMRLLADDPVELTLVGPTEIAPTAWRDLPNLVWKGPVARSEVGRFYDEADILILPTLSDGYALTQLEALSRGLPVLASRQCGAAVVEGENGWLLENLEPATIADALRKLAGKEFNLKVRPPKYDLQDLAEALLANVAQAK